MSLSSYFHLLWFSPSCLCNFTLLQFREQLQNQFADKFPRKSATKCQRPHMNLLPRSNVAKFLTLCVLMSKSENVRSPRDLFKSLSPGSSVDSNTGRIARLHKTLRSSATPFKKRFVRTFLPSNAASSMKDSAPRFQSRNAGMFLVVSARLSMAKNVTK